MKTEKEFMLREPSGELVDQFNSFWEKGCDAPEKKVSLFEGGEMVDIFDILGNSFFDGLAEDDKRIHALMQDDSTFHDALRLINSVYHAGLRIDFSKMCSRQEFLTMCREEIEKYENIGENESRTGGFDRFMKVCREATGRNAYSFATKAFCFQNGERFPILDRITVTLLAEYLGSPRKREWGIYENYKRDYELFRQKYGLTSYSFKKIDVFLWTYGIAIESYWKKIGVFDFESVSYQQPK